MMYKDNRPGRDLGPNPAMIHLPRAAANNRNFRTAIWTGTHLQLTLMNIDPGSEIGTEIHKDVDQMLRVEEGTARVYVGPSPQRLRLMGIATRGTAIMIPAGTWHNVKNAANAPLKLSSVYGPPQHPRGTVHRTKADSDAAHYSRGES